jgi:hypothetical protein
MSMGRGKAAAEQRTQMEITLTPGAAQRIREVLGDDLDLAPSAVPSILARLAVEAPSVYSHVLAELSGTQIRLDSERALARSRRWRALRARLFWWGEYESDAGDRLIAKRHVAAAIPLGLAGLILLSLAASSFFRHHASVPSARHTTPPASHTLMLRSFIAEHARPPLVAHTNPGRPASVASPVAGLPPVPQAWTVTSAASAPDPALPRSPLVFNRDQEPAAFSATAALRGAAPSEATPPGSPLVYDRDAAAPEQAGRGDGAELADGAAGPGENAHWTVGARLTARLATGVLVASSGTPSPAIAETDHPAAAWLGEATLSPDGRIEIRFTVTQGRSTAHGVALDPDHLVPGLAGRTTLRQPQVAAAALIAAAQATAAYGQALAQQGLTLSGSWGQATVGQAAPPWAYLASSLAGTVAPRSSVSGPIATSELPAGAPLVILVTEAS